MTAESEPSSQTPPANVPVPLEPADPQETEIRIDTYKIVADWIRFADAKAAVVLTVSGALASVFIPTLKGFLNRGSYATTWWPYLVLTLFFTWLVLLIIACAFALRCITPFRQKGRHPALEKCTHFHPAAICVEYRIDETERFIQDCETGGVAGLRQEVFAGLLIDAHISGAKYKFVTRAIKILAVSAIFGFLYLLTSQF